MWWFILQERSEGKQKHVFILILLEIVSHTEPKDDCIMFRSEKSTLIAAAATLGHVCGAKSVGKIVPE